VLGAAAGRLEVARAHSGVLGPFAGVARPLPTYYMLTSVALMSNRLYIPG
jgi:hypothetical protein